jgi:hypothetical protein
LLRNCYQDSSVVLLGLNAATRSGRQAILELLLLPLKDETAGHRVLGCIIPHQRQFWHGLEPVESLNLHSIRIIDPEREPLFLANRPEVLFSPSIAPSNETLGFDPPKTGVQLLVIQGGKSAT